MCPPPKGAGEFHLHAPEATYLAGSDCRKSSGLSTFGLIEFCLKHARDRIFSAGEDLRSGLRAVRQGSISRTSRRIRDQMLGSDRSQPPGRNDRLMHAGDHAPGAVQSAVPFGH